MSSINFTFYQDHVTTREETNKCREALIDKLAANGCAFSDALSGQKYSADELKGNGKGSYMIERNGVSFLLMVNTDSSYGDFGDSYGVVLTKKS